MSNIRYYAPTGTTEITLSNGTKLAVNSSGYVTADASFAPELQRAGFTPDFEDSVNARRQLNSGAWESIPSVFRLLLTGTGTVTIDSKDALGNITTGVASYTVNGATNQIEFPYAGDGAVAIRAMLTGTATAEVI